MSVEDGQAGELPPVGQGASFSKGAWGWLGEDTQGPSLEGAAFSKPLETRTLLFSLLVNPSYSAAAVPRLTDTAYTSWGR